MLTEGGWRGSSTFDSKTGYRMFDLCSTSGKLHSLDRDAHFFLMFESEDQGAARNKQQMSSEDRSIGGQV